MSHHHIFKSAHVAFDAVMRVALIYPPFHYRQHEENSEVVTENFGIYPPSNLLYVAATLERHGHQVMLVDAHCYGYTREEAFEIVKGFHPDILGFTLHSTFMFTQTIDWLKYFKTGLNLPVIVGGFHFINYTEEAMQHQEIDFGIWGSAQEALPQLLECLEQGTEYRHIERLCYRENGKVVMNKTANPYLPESTLPFPARHLIDNSRYYSFISQYRNFTAIWTSRGCPYLCNFCEERKSGFDTRTVQQIVDEMEDCYRNYGIREFDIFDVIFTFDKNRTRAICKDLLRRGLKIHWSIRTRVDRVDDSLLRLMARAGCTKIYYGIESADQQILNRMKKGTTILRIKKTIATTHRYGIRTLGFFMVGNPGDTVKTIRKTIDFAKELDLHYVQFGIMTAKPKTELHKDLIQREGKDYWSLMSQGQEDIQQLDRPWVDLSNEDLRYWMKRAYIEFYLRPSYIFWAVTHVKSFHELYRGTKAAKEMGVAYLRSSLGMDSKNIGTVQNC